MQEPTLDQYLKALQRLLRKADRAMTDEESVLLRDIVRERRNGRHRHTAASLSVEAYADTIVQLIGRAAPHLRPRETQQLDDLVAGKTPKPAPIPGHPIRSHRNGLPRR